MRVEANVAVTKDDVDVLTAYPRELHSLGPGTIAMVAGPGSSDQETSSVRVSLGIPADESRLAPPAYSRRGSQSGEEIDQARVP